MQGKKGGVAFGGYGLLLKSSMTTDPSVMAFPHKSVLGSICLGRSPLAVHAIDKNFAARSGENGASSLNFKSIGSYIVEPNSGDKS